MSRRFTSVLVLLACFAAGLLVAGKIRETTEAGAQSTTPSRPPVTTPGPVANGGTLPDFSRVAERTVPAVVNISATQIVRRQVPRDPFFTFFGGAEDFFGSRRGVENSLGSGVIVSSDGYILTNNHVVTGEDRRVTIEQLDVTVALSDKREVPAQVVGTDPATDLALLKINARDLPTMPWGDSSKLKVAEWVLAIGNPYQLSQTVTLGIVSALGRNNLGVSTYEDFIQTDAAINPGNSGGALINGRGELVGINTAIFSQSGGYQGIGFAVPSNLVRRVVDDLQKFGRVRRGSIGYVEVIPLTGRLADELRAPKSDGDIILAVNGTTITDPSQFTRMISDAAINSTIRVEILRDGKRSTLRIPVEAQQERRTRR